MSDKKITELNNITSANLSDVDEFVVVDISGDETKAITYGELKQFNGAISSDGLTVNGDITATGGDLNLDTLDLNAIAESKAVTAVDVFVYDTSKDSDGGAWRKRTQGTSWYNETLDTATRGSRREFPAVAVIVAEAAKVTIYDGDDPSLPMWMVFTGGANFFINTSSSGAVGSTFAANGKLCVGQSAGNHGVREANFVSDFISLRNATARYDASSVISGRNAIISVSATVSSAAIVNSTVNDVAMTVLPDAPIDPATGLQVPIIAVATDGGVSVIKDDGTVVDTTDGNAYNTVFFTDDNRLWLGRAGAAIIEYGDIFTADVSSVTWRDGYYGTNTLSSNLFLTSDGADRFDLLVTGAAAATNGDRLAFISENPTTSSEGMVAYTTSTYNTGWMNGDIKGAFLSDTDDTDLVGSEVWTDPPDTIGSGWTDDGGGSYSATPGSFSDLNVDPITAGNYYVFTWTVTGRTAGYTRAKIPGIITSAGQSANGTFTATLYSPTESSISIEKSDTFDGTVSAISVQLADYDRSVNNNGLIINGTVTRTKTVLGGDAVWYSGFSSGDYLWQPYNSDFNFGTGDLCLEGWALSPAGAAADIIDCTEEDGSRQNGFWLFGRGNSLRTYNAGVTVSFLSGVTMPVDTPHKICWTLTEGGTRGSLFLNGKLVYTGVQAANDIAAITSRTLKLGNGITPYTGSLAKWRISGTAPSPDQILKSYRDEYGPVVLGQPETLYGTSDAVTALAHDSDTNLLHVGTSDGRSVFQGLRRVSNTTTAVGTAISASNGLVVEE